MKDSPDVATDKPAASSPRTASNRLVSLDAFRGITIAGMMLANNAGDWGHVYKPLKHAEWHGWTITDAIFPFFLWIVGVAIPFSLIRKMEQGEDRSKLWMRVVRRAVLLFALGFFLNSFTYFFNAFYSPEGVGHWMGKFVDNVRIPGVLQRIGVCYLITGIVVLTTRIRGQVIATVGFLLLYWALMAFGSMPGFPAGDLSKAGNFSHYVDSILLKNHVWGSSKTWDPEGIISTLPAISTCLFGVLAGHLLRSHRTPSQKTSWLLAGGFALVALGQVLNIWMPINKPIWTSSYSVFMAGLAMIVLGVCYWVIDVRGIQKWARPFSIYGMNAIAVFVLAGMLGRLSIDIKVTDTAGKLVALKSFLYGKFFAPLAAPGGFLHDLNAATALKNASLMWALMYMLGLYLVAYLLYRKKWFIRV